MWNIINVSNPLSKVSECTDSHIRGVIGSFPALAMSAGILMSYILGDFLNWNQLAWSWLVIAGDYNLILALYICGVITMYIFITYFNTTQSCSSLRSPSNLNHRFGWRAKDGTRKRSNHANGLNLVRLERRPAQWKYQKKGNARGLTKKHVLIFLNYNKDEILFVIVPIAARPL